MSSFVDSASSVHSSVADVIASYRRSQYFAAEPTLPSDDSELADQENGFAQNYEQNLEDEALPTPHPRYDGFISQLEWDGFEESSNGPTNTGNGSTETTPLMRRLSFSSPYHRHGINADPLSGKPPIRRHSSGSTRQSVMTDGVAGKSTATHEFVGKSTFGQTVSLNLLNKDRVDPAKLFNSVAILVGVGILSVSLAFSYAGWLMGTILIIFYGFISCYT